MGKMQRISFVTVIPLHCLTCSVSPPAEVRQFLQDNILRNVSELLGTTETAAGKVQPGACERNQKC